MPPASHRDRAAAPDPGPAGEVHATVARRLRADGQRYTGGRRVIVGILDEARRPLTIGEILSGEQELAQSSAYRNLAVLERAGVVHKVVTNDEFARFELAEDLTGHHHHLICSGCGAVADFTLGERLEHALEQAFAEVARQHRFQAEHHRMDLVGRCPTCSAGS